MNSRRINSFLSLGIMFVLALALVLPSFSSVEAQESAAQAKSVILLIGDGMGMSHIRISEVYAQDVLGRQDPLALRTLPYLAVTSTYSADSQVTDSSSAGTAIMSGYKCNNGAVNILPTGEETYTIGQAAHDAGKAVGLVTTTRITHATPASVFAHTPDRDDENLIAEQLVEFAPEVALGGGWRHFVPQSADGTKREDDRDLVSEMQSAGYTYAASGTELAAIDTASVNKLFGFFTKSHMDYDVDRVSQAMDQPALADMTDIALQTLDNDPEGFFLMVEGGRIDHAAHAHDPIGVVLDTLAFDAAVQVALDYQAAHPDVLVIVTADHETGGLGIGIDSDVEYFSNIPSTQSFTCSMEYLNSMVASDPTTTSDDIAGCGFVLTEAQNTELALYAPEIIPADVEGTPSDASGALSWAHYVLADAESDGAGLGWTTWSHTGEPVLTLALGPGADMVNGMIDNTEIATIMAQALGVTLQVPAAVAAN